ncbi:2,3-dihydroxybenzoate-AMP ligase [Rhodococcus sp. 14-2470-1b]|uniref:(2,3-dihydroxybenzoyl)adenylate synthase n=1 Tax=Rhodococcus sp. 14-2470-1b TaxID=2023149 RepID=UPI000B9B8978|nr:AMP-binding protein [Rhodococcus sp. 14-2470-1b]OZF56500.1 2,3-dihydroxybenzoate-AMP ligase [Rhodococcus sp. 14-2470-1b]
MTASTHDLAPLVLDGVVPYPPEFAQRYRDEGIWVDQTFTEFLFSSIEQHSEETALIFGDTRITYGHLGERILTIAAGFERLGIRRGERVVVHLPNIPDYVALVFALYEIGAVPVLTPVALRLHEIGYIVEESGARGYIATAAHDGNDLAALAAELKSTSSTLEHTIIVDADGLEPLLAQGTLEHRRRSLPSDVAFLALSGGTTDRPKLVPHTHETYLASVRAAAAMTDITSDTVQLVVLPMSHSFAMRSPGYLSTLAAGGTVVMAPNGSPDVSFPLIAEHGVTIVALVPPLALAWLNSSLKERYDLSTLAVIQVGGAKFSPDSARRVRPELGATVQQSFGMAEGLHTFTRLDADEDIITTRQGRPTTDYDEIRVVDSHGQNVDRGTAGDLLTRGPSTIRGYYNAPQHQNVFTEDGFYRTGDIVVQGADGYLTVTGRSKDQINRGGEKVAPAEVEDLLLAHESVHEASVQGIPDAVLGERVKAFLLPREGVDPKSLSLPKVRQFLKAKGLATYKLPDVVELVTEFERTAVGKISKRK